MKFIVKDLDIRSGGSQIIILNEQDALRFGIHHEDRVLLKRRNKNIHAVVDLAESEKFVKVGEVGLFEEVLVELNVKENDKITLELIPKPKSINYIRQKLYGKRFTPEEIYTVVEDIVKGRLSSVEIAFFVAASAVHGLNDKETAALTKAMIATGDTLSFKGVVADKHCTGGVAGNRTTLLIVPILAAAGVTMPKTSSRAITSPAGTADTMEVLAPVKFTRKQMESIVKKVGGCIVWGGSINLAPADDKIIRIEKPLNIDAEGQLLASILAKKGSVGATHVLIDIPVGKQTKIRTRKEANHLKEKFLNLGKKLGMKIEVMITPGNQPIGNGIGPVLEARDAFWILEQDARRALDFEEKAIKMAGKLLVASGKAKNGEKKAREILTSGKALKKFQEIIKAQGGVIKSSKQLSPGKYNYVFKSNKNATIKDIHNSRIARVAKFAGAPQDPGAGIFLHKHEKDKVKKGEPILTIYAENKQKLEFAKKLLDGNVVILQS